MPPMKIIPVKCSNQSDVPADFNNVNKSAKPQTYHAIQTSDEDSKYQVESSKVLNINPENTEICKE